MKRIIVLSIIASIICMLLSPAMTAYASFIQPEQEAKKSRSHEANILEHVKTYTPDRVSRWQEELTERDQLRSKLRELKKSSAFSKKHQQLHKEVQDRIDRGEITRDQAKKILTEKQQEYVQKHKQWKEEGLKLRAQLEKAIEQGNKEEAAKTLDAMLDRLTQANDKLAQHLGTLEAPSSSGSHWWDHSHMKIDRLSS